MRNKIFTTILLAIIITFSIQLSAQAVIISTDKQVESGSGTVTISITSNKLLGAYTLKLTDTAGLTLVSTAGGEVSADKKTVTGSAAEGTQSLGTYTFNVPTVKKDTTYNIKFSITGMETPSLETVADETNTAVLTVKAPVVEEPAPKPTPEPEPQPQNPAEEEKPNFTDTNKTMYASKDINLRASWSTSSKATSIDKGTELTVTGTSTNKVNGYAWYRVTYNGQTLYVASNLLTSEKPEEKVEEPEETPNEEEPVVVDENDEKAEAKEGLKSLEIEGVTLSPKFNPSIYEYRVILKENINELDVKAVTVSEDASITIAGNDDLQEGENLIIIVVYNAKNEVEATYQITVNKNTLDLTDTDNLLQSGTQTAKRNLIIFISILSIAIIALIVVIILKRKNENNEEEYDDEFEKEFTNNEENVENTIKQTNKEEQAEEIPRPRREKRKGKHF